jgi:hypothetical protein
LVQLKKKNEGERGERDRERQRERREISEIKERLESVIMNYIKMYVVVGGK